MKYVGVSWAELGVRFKLITLEQYEDSSYDEDELLEEIKDYISNNTGVGDHLYKIRRHLREHLTLLIERDKSYKQPLWRGLLNIEDEHTFMQMCIPLIGYMWD